MGVRRRGKEKERESKRQVHHGDTPSIIHLREKEIDRERDCTKEREGGREKREVRREKKREIEGTERWKKKGRKRAKSRVLCLELVYGCSFKLSLRGTREFQKWRS